MDVVSAGGKHLGHFPSQKVLEAFRRLPEEDRRPSGGKLPALGPGEAAVPAPPKNGLVLRAHTRALARDEKGEYRPVRAEDYPLVKGNVKHFESLKRIDNFGPNVDSLWLTEAEWRALVPATPVKGERFDVAPAVTERLARFHLVPQKMVGGGGVWGKAAVRKARLALVVEDVTPERVRLRAEGLAHLGSAYDPAKATTPNGPLGR